MFELKHITKIFSRGTPDEKRALNDLSMILNDGDFVTVIGGNGAGKSTMQNVISGAQTPEEGQVLLDGVDGQGWHSFRWTAAGLDPAYGHLTEAQIAAAG